MRRRAFAFPIAALGLISALGAAQDAAIRGATIALVPKTVAVQTVTIENRRQSPLLAWAIRTGHSVRTSDFTWQIVRPGADHGPIDPGKQRVFDVELQLTPGVNSAPPSTLELAVFADGVVEGTAAAIERWRSERREHADDAVYWREAFEKMPRDSEERAKQYLAARVAERAAVVREDRSGTRGRLFRLWHETPQPPGWVFAVVESIEKEAMRQAEVLNWKVAVPQSLESAAPLLITSRPSTKTDYVVAIRNLRETPIEELAYDYYEPGNDRPSGGVAARAGRDGLIAAGQTREFQSSRAIKDPALLPSVKLRYVLFDDLVFEGPASERAELFRRREHLADDIAFANAIRAELAKVPDAELRAFLVKKRTERAAHLLTLKRTPEVSAVDRMIEELARSPERLRESAAAAIADDEQQRQRLLRHVR